MLKRVLLCVAALGFASPAVAGDPVPGIGIGLDANNGSIAGGQRVLSITVDRSRLPEGRNLAAAIGGNISDTLAEGRVRAGESEIASVARQVVEMSGARESGTARQCFETWCASIRVGGER